jgi:hypothetical protein
MATCTLLRVRLIVSPQGPSRDTRLIKNTLAANQFRQISASTFWSNEQERQVVWNFGVCSRAGQK